MLVVGVMSGTSADGANVALVHIKDRGAKRIVELKAFQVYPYSKTLRKQIFALFPGNDQDAPNSCTEPIAQISHMNFLLGKVFANAVLKCLKNAGISPVKVDLIGSHGQTIYHCPKGSCKDKQCEPSTLQIGEGAVIAELTGIPVISDFRTADVAAGGTGAPLVPYPDYLLFSDKTKGRLLLNIGGIANITYLPPGGSLKDVIAFDTGPGNMLIDAVVSLVTEGRKGFDEGGKIANEGEINREALAWLLSSRYFSKSPPKATGRELFGAQLARELFKRFPSLNSRDAVATVTALTIETVAMAVERFVVPGGPIHECFIAGGGTGNKFMLEQLALKCPEILFYKTDFLGIPAEAREAIAFALLAYESWHKRPGNLPKITGARHPAILGKLSLVARG